MNKQIEEMVKCSDCIHYSICSLWSTTDLDKDEAYKYCFGNFKNAVGYRKSTDVVAEVLADVMFAVSKIVSEHIESDNSLLEAEVDIIHALTKLKKKHESEKVDNEQTN